MPEKERGPCQIFRNGKPVAALVDARLFESNRRLQARFDARLIARRALAPQRRTAGVRPLRDGVLTRRQPWSRIQRMSHERRAQQLPPGGSCRCMASTQQPPWRCLSGEHHDSDRILCPCRSDSSLPHGSRSQLGIARHTIASQLPRRHPPFFGARKERAIVNVLAYKLVMQPHRRTSRFLASLSAAIVLTGPQPAKAILNYYIYESGGNVVVKTTGSLNLRTPTYYPNIA
jgi:hypothetical protein